MLPAGAVLLASYPSEHSGVLSKVAFTYDNAVAAIALVGCGQARAGGAHRRCAAAGA
jgi:hypothetical protein